MPDLDQPRNLPRTIWSAAAIGAVAIHAGGIALALASMQPESATDLGAPAIEIGIGLTAPRVDPSELPVGPDTEAAAPSPAVVEQKNRNRAQRLAEGGADRDRRSRSCRRTQRNQKTGRRAETANRAGAAFDRVDCCGGDRDAHAAKCAGSAAFGRS